jgi:hypothetical protein
MGVDVAVGLPVGEVFVCARDVALGVTGTAVGSTICAAVGRSPCACVPDVGETPAGVDVNAVLHPLNARNMGNRERVLTIIFRPLAHAVSAVRLRLPHSTFYRQKVFHRLLPAWDSP